MEDIRKLMPHCKTESKFEKSSSFRDLMEVATVSRSQDRDEWKPHLYCRNRDEVVIVGYQQYISGVWFTMEFYRLHRIAGYFFLGKLKTKRKPNSPSGQVCEERSCNNCIYFEARKKKDLYMWITRVPYADTRITQTFLTLR